jgi:carboxyl-terminal processing protease
MSDAPLPRRPCFPVFLLVLAPFAVFLLVLAAFAGGVFADRRGWVPGRPPDRQPARLGKTFAPFWEAWDHVDKNFVDRSKVDDERMTQGAIKGMLESLGDKGHTLYLSREDHERQQEQLAGQIEGIGAYVGLHQRQHVIFRTIPGSPARTAGVRPGDVVLAVDGQPVAGLSQQQVRDKVRGPAGSKVQLSVRRAKRDKPLEITVERAQVEFPRVTWRLFPGTPAVAHVAILSFSKNTHSQLTKGLAEARAAGAKGVVLDLRGNSGGLKEQAILVASEFLPEGTVVFIQKDAKGNEERVAAKAGGTATDLPLAVLIDRNSASSSEIVAGALQDHRRAKLVGETTYGTGTVLRQYKLSDGGVVWLAHYLWLTPNGREIWHKGISPDEGLRVPLPAGAVLLTPDPDTPLSAAELAASGDTQVRTALEVLRREVR